MGISQIVDIKGNHYYRVSRTWMNQEQQSYMPFRDDPQAAYVEALKQDKLLKQKQDKFLSKWKKSYFSLQKSSGQIKFLSLRVVKRKGRKPAPELRLRIPSVNNKTFSISLYGFDLAYEYAIQSFVEHYEFDKPEEARNFLKAAKTFYRREYDEVCAEVVPLFKQPLIRIPSHLISNTENQAQKHAYSLP